MRALVTGGGGFLGKAIATRLRSSGIDVRSLTRGEYPELIQLGVECLRGDVADAATVLQATEGCDVVFHVAAKAGVWGPYEAYFRANVVGTENVLQACRAHHIWKLVYTSSPSVVFDGQDETGIDESAPYPRTFLAHYPRTKALAERMVLSANGEKLTDGMVLATTSLRPHLIWGPGDNHLLPRLIERARQGKLQRIGPGTNLVDTVYIDNAADAHILAAEKLEPSSPIAGKAYFITNGQPMPLWNLIDHMLGCAGLPPVRRQMSARSAYIAGAILEALYKTMRWSNEPPMTRFVARQLATAHWFNISAARRDLGYEPHVTVEEGLLRLTEWLKTQTSR